MNWRPWDMTRTWSGMSIKWSLWDVLLEKMGKPSMYAVLYGWICFGHGTSEYGDGSMNEL